MKTIIIVFTLFLTTSVAYSHDHSSEFRVICERIQGCATYNNAKTPQEYCPTCSVINNGTDKNDYVAWGKEVRKELRYLWDKNYFKNDSPKKEPSGWALEVPNRYGLRVPYN